MKKHINNPFVGQKGYNCFGCSPCNPVGLHLKFVEEGDFLTAVWSPEDHFQGYNNLLHGGIQSTLMDEIASWFIYVKMKTAGLTSRLEVRYKKPVYTNEGQIKLKAWMKAQRRNLVDVAVELYDSNGQLCATGVVQYFTFSENVAKEKFLYPTDHNRFYEMH
jgi:acyl-coenzyme A thioesterase PaaI-like protein